MLDPHKVIDRDGGLLIDLEDLTTREEIASHYECFHNYFGYSGSHQYDGTIFRFPLRTGGYETKISNNVYNPAKVRTSLFTPFKCEIENCLLFMKSVNKITISVKSNSGTQILYSAEVSDRFRDGLAMHRGEIFKFVDNGHYLNYTQFYISVFPIYTMDTERSMRLWVVINMLGLGAGKELYNSYKKQPDSSYLPWFAIALPLPHNPNTMKAFDNVFCWSVEYTDLSNVFQFLQSLPCISISNVVGNFVGNLFCFLPTAAISNFPFHIHGYFALTTNRRAIKWPRHDDLSDEARWNRDLVDVLGTVCYAVLVCLMVSRVRSDGGNAFHYDLWRCKQASNGDDQLECVLHKGAFEILQATELVWSMTGKNWIELEMGYYLPSVVNSESIPCENICKSLLLLLQQPLIDVPSNVANFIIGYEFLFNKVRDRIVDPKLIRSLLIRFKNDGSLIKFLKNLENVCCLLEIVLSDVNLSATNISTTLQHIPLIPVCNSEVPLEFGSQGRYFISADAQDYLKIFPGLVSSFIKRDLPSHIHQSLLALSRTKQVNIEDITNLSNNPTNFVNFLEYSMNSHFNLNANVVWRPNASQQPDKSWIESVWKFIDQNYALIYALQTRKLPILPKQSLNSPEIELLQLNTKRMSYIQRNSAYDYSKIEKLLTDCGCHICYHHVFILPFHNFVYHPIPQGLFSILQHQPIQQAFINKLSLANDSIKLAVIDIIMSTPLTPQNVNIVKSFPIFRSISNIWVSISTLHCIPPDSLPRDFTQYPDTFLSPHDLTNTNLCMKVVIPRISITQTIQIHLLPLITKSTINQSQSNILSLWILRNISQFDQNLINILTTSKWILDSSNSKLCSPQQLYDPSDDIFTQLVPFTGQQGIFPNSVYNRQHSSLRSLGMVTSETISYQNLEYIIRTTLQNVAQIGRDGYNKWLNSLVDLITLHMDRFNLTHLTNFWEIFQQTAFILPSTRDQCTSYPRSLPFDNSKSCLYPRDVIYCKEKEASLVAGVTPVFVESSKQADKQKTVYIHMGMSHKIPVDFVCQQLVVIMKQTRYNHNEIHSLVKKIYKYFANIISSQGDLRGINLPNNFIFIPERGFFTTERVVMSCDDKFSPHIISLSKHYPIYEESFNAFFKAFNIDKEVGMAKCILILNNLDTFITLSVEDVSLASKVIQLIGELIGTDRDGILMLAQDNILYPAVECVFNDLTWLNRSKLCTNKPIVHRNISSITASKLGCKPASVELASTAESISYSFVTAAGQTEDLVDRLRGILEGYRMQTDVFNELIQNSDDAGASCVKVLFDYTSHPATKVLHKNVEEIHGPAMYLFNNAKFTERDFESILKLSSCNKLSDTEKIGRFGVGFNAVYNFTDCPSFVSGDSVQIFDPLQRYVSKFSKAAGIRLRFANDATAVETFTDQFRVYQDVFDCDILSQKEYDYTLFRLPFRLQPNRLSNQTYNEDSIKRLQTTVINELSNLILFLQNIHCIEVYERKLNIPTKCLLRVTKDDCPTTHFLRDNKQYFNSYKDTLTTRVRPLIMTSADTVTVCIESHGKKTDKSYLIAYASGVGDCYDVMKRFDLDKITFLPLCGVAFPLEYMEKIPERLICKIYTFLPLPIRSPLCLNINCYFSLTDSRKHLNDAYVGEGMIRQKDILTDWNLALINDALPNALICALEELHSTLPLFLENASSVLNYYSIWPVKENTNILWKDLPEHFAKKIIELFPATNLFLSAHINVWIPFQKIYFLKLENDLIQNTEFTRFVYELSADSEILFANIPDSFYSSTIFRIFSEIAPEKIFCLERLCNKIIFPRLHTLPLHNLVLVFGTLVQLCSESIYCWLLSKLIETRFIPCGSGGDNFTLRIPSHVVCPNTTLSTLYQPEEMRIPVPELHSLFALDKLTPVSNALKKMCVIYDTLPETEMVSRCEITSDLTVEKATSHAVTLIEYLGTLDKEKLKSINDLIKDIPFVPTYHDELFEILQIPLNHFVAPNECYSFQCRHLVTPLSAASKSIYSISCLSLKTNPNIEVVFRVLDCLESNVALIKQHNIKIQEKVLQIYKFLSKKEQQDEIKVIKHTLSTCQWIWHPSNQQFYATNQVILSNALSLPENTYLVNFPYMETISNDSKLETFLKTVGIEEEIHDDTIIACIKRIHDNEVSPLSDNLVKLILKLIESITFHEDCADTIYVLSKTDTLKRPYELYLSPIFIDTDDISIFIHDRIIPIDAFKLGVKHSAELFSSESDINEEDFGIEEEITDRIQTLVRELPVDSFIKELIQNAEDSGATEIVFILDEQDYSSHNETLILDSSLYPNWKKLHSFPSLTVFNNKGFSEEDIKGIQKLSVGGKLNDQKSIGKFGLGFNSVYQITDAPSFITHQPMEAGLHFCCFDPFLKYTTSKYKGLRKKRGKKFCIQTQNLPRFEDQLFPFTFEQFRNEPIIASCLSNNWPNGDFSMFRFPLDIEIFPSDDHTSSVFTKHISYRKTESRKHVSMKDVERMLIEQIKQSSEILLFLNNVKSLKVIKIDRFRKVSLLCSQSIRILKETRIPRPTWFPQGNDQDIIVHNTESINQSTRTITDQSEWLIYIHPDVPIEEYVKIDNTMSDHSKKLIEEKLWGFGGIAVCISPRDRHRQSNIYTFLPVGSSANFPVHINAPLFVDSSRQNVHYEQSDLAKAWHNSVIQNIMSPLYTLLLVELRSPTKPVTSLDEKIGYYEWFYSLFPNTVFTSNIKLLSELSEQIYNFLYTTNQAIFLAHNLDISDNITWYNIHGPGCGILLPKSFFHISKTTEQPSLGFKFSVDIPYLFKTEDLRVSTEKEDEIRKSLISINLPLTFAPLKLKTRFKDNQITQLDQSLLLIYLNENLHCLFRDGDSPLNLTSSILSFKQMETILEYVLTAESKVFDTCDIPIRIDIHGNFLIFKKCKPCFMSTYAVLLPHRSKKFISTKYSLEIIIKLMSLGFVEQINNEYLSKHLSVDQFEDISICCPLFWKFVRENLPKVDLNKFFGAHQLVPLSSYIQSTSIQFLPIKQLEFVVSPTLKEKESTLYSALNRLRCPILNINIIKRTLTYLDDIAISQIRSSEVIINSISLSDDVTADLEEREVYRLLQILDQVRKYQFDTDKIPLLCSLKIFKTQSGEFSSLSQCEIYFLNDVYIQLGPVLLQKLFGNNQLVILVPSYTDLITSLCHRARKRLLNVSDLLSQMVFPLLDQIPVEEQKEIVLFISQKLTGRNNLTHLIVTLVDVAFVTSDDGRKLRFNQFYSHELSFFTKFLSHTTLPKVWRDENIRFLINKLGLRQEISLQDIHDVIVMFSQKMFPSSYLPDLFEAFIPILSKIDYEIISDITILRQIAEIQFLPVWSIECITRSDEVTYSPQLVRFCDAQLVKFENCCCTTSWIHSIDFKLPKTCYQYLGMSEYPNISTVNEHLIKIIDQITEAHSILEIPMCYENYFLKSYSILEKYISDEYQSADVSLAELNRLPCIIWDMKLYYPINMLFNSNEILHPFVIQLPATLAGKFPQFFKLIGVEETATYRHFALVLIEIDTLLQRLDEELSDSDYLQQTEKVFNSLITALRKLETQNLPCNLDLNQTLLLTRDSRLISSANVIFADNVSLLSRLNKLGIPVNILKPLEPDENKSCIPPNCLRLEKLTRIISEQLDRNVLLHKVIGATYISQILQRTLKCPVVFRCMQRLYFHLTKKDLGELLLNNGETCFSDDDLPPPGFQSVSHILNRLRVVSVTYIDTIITDKRQTPHTAYPLTNACSCYIDETNDTFLLADNNTSRCIQKDIAFAINSYLGGIFTNVLSSFELCFMLEPYEIMEKLDEYNVDRDPWPIPQQPPPAPVPSGTYYSHYSNQSFSSTSHYVAPTIRSYSAPRLRSRPRPQPRGVAIGVPDLPAARLWFMIAQCDVIAARKLIHQTADCVNAFPAHACFFCFESVTKVFTALLHLYGSKERLDSERNLRVLIDQLSCLIAGQVCTQIEVLTIPLMNYDIETRIPNSTLVRCIPQQLISLEQSQEAIRNTERIIELVTGNFSDMREMKLDDNDPIFRCLTSAQPTLITAVLRCKLLY